ncbi:MAG: dihydrofolate reductase family protein [Saprospiraceae bacterium]|nr:dihydrofolate reductase family protein [Saprospiraceae bacterium]
MRKLKLQVQITVDGFITGTNGEMNWMVYPWTKDLSKYVMGLTEPTDTIVLGKNLAEGFIPHWASTPDGEDPKFVDKMNDAKKVVFTKTLDKAIWKNTTLAKGDLTEEILKIKNETGKDIMVYGGSQFVSSLIKSNLIDEYYLFINPTAIGNGLPIFKEINQNLNLELVECKKFDCGIAIMKYLPKK